MSGSYYQLSTGRVAAIDLNEDFPPLQDALIEPNGLIAIGGDLSVQRLLRAYKSGIFPWFSDGDPLLWWSPHPRMVLFPDNLKISTSLKKILKKPHFEVRFNTVFREVITACSQTNRTHQAGTWITEDIINAYCDMYEAGHAICAETWVNNTLVGGCYGIRIGNMFYGESMFHHQTDASKIAFVRLVEQLKTEGVGMIDCQMNTAHLASFGGIEISREDFAKRLSELISTL